MQKPYPSFSYLAKECFCDNSLNYLSKITARDITISVIADFGREATFYQDRFGSTKKQIEWVLEVLCYGMSLPLSDIEIIKTCSNIYCTWITNYIIHSSEIPEIIAEDWDYFFPILLHHLLNLFVPRNEPNSNLHAPLCSKVLSVILAFVNSAVRTPLLYDEILKFLLIITSKILCSIPNFIVPLQSLADNVGDVLSSHLFLIWLAISIHHYPSESQWILFTDVTSHCLHNQQFIFQWSCFCLVLTKDVIASQFSPSPAYNIFLDFHVNNNCISKSVNGDLLLHCWLKILYCVGNVSILSQPIELCRRTWPELQSSSFNIPNDLVVELTSVKNTNDFMVMVHNHVDRLLPHAFYLSMRFLSCFIQLMIPTIQPSRINFTKLYNYINHKLSVNQNDNSSANLIISKKMGSRTSNQDGTSNLFYSDVLPHFINIVEESVVAYDFLNLDFISPLNCNIHRKISSTKCNTILNLISDWILNSCVNLNEISSTEDIDFVIKRNLDLSFPSIANPSVKLYLSNSYEMGRAQAFTLMLRLVTTEPDNRYISPVYISHLLTILPFGLMYHQHNAWIIFRSIIFSSINLFNSNLAGMNILIPHYLRAINLIVTRWDNPYDNENDPSQIRYAALRIMNSIIPIALNICGGGCDDISSITDQPLSFDVVALYIINTLNVGFENETDGRIIQLYLNAMTTMLHEISIRKFVPSYPSTENLLENYKLSQPSNIEEQKNTAAPIHPKTIFEIFVSTCTKSVKDRLTAILSLKSVDLNISLSLFDFLRCLSIFDKQYLHKNECMQIIIFICKYIEALANKPSIQHSRDLHSAIVSAYYSILYWVKNHKWLLLEKICLESIVEIIELGLSGSKSVTMGSTEVILKENKVHKPISYRVFDAAEYLLLILLEFMPFYHMYCDNNDEQILTEQHFLELLPINEQKTKIHNFILGNFAIITTIDINLSMDENSKKNPSVVVLVRSLMGKHVYYFENKSSLNVLENIGEVDKSNYQITIEETDKSPLHDLKIFSFPTLSSEAWKNSISQNSFPTLSKLTEKYIPNYNELSSLLNNTLNKTKADNISYFQSTKKLNNCGIKELKSIKFNNQYNSFRILLANLSMIRFASFQEIAEASIPKLIELEYTPQIENNLTILDRIPVRHTEFVYLFVLNESVRNTQDILYNKKTIYSESFNKFVEQLGDVVSVKDHSGYLGPFDKNSPNYHFIYHACMMNELIIVPSYSIFDDTSSTYISNTVSSECLNDAVSIQKVFENQNSTDSSQSCTNVKDENSLKSDKNNFTKQNTKSVSISHSYGIVLIWIDNLVELNYLPIQKLIVLMNQKLNMCDLDFNPHMVILINPLNNGYFRIKNICISQDRQIVAIAPLFDETVVSIGILSQTISDCIFSYLNKRKLQIDIYSSPKMKRKNFIQNMSKTLNSTNISSQYFIDLFNF